MPEESLEVALDLLLNKGAKIPELSSELGISQPTLRRIIADVQKKQGLLLQYRSIQSLQLTELQARCLEAITPQKIEEAPLKDLVSCYKILKDKEQVIEGKPSEIRGLVAHLIYMEKQEKALAAGEPMPDDFTDAEFSDDVRDEQQQEEAPPNLPTTLSQLDQQVF